MVDLFMPDATIDILEESGIIDVDGAPSTPSKMKPVAANVSQV